MEKRKDSAREARTSVESLRQRLRQSLESKLQKRNELRVKLVLPQSTIFSRTVHTQRTLT